MNAEIWRDVKGYEGLYRVSSKGRVMSLPRQIKRKDGVMRRVRGGMCTLTMTNKYPSMNFSKNGKFKSRSIAAVMMEAFNKEFDHESMRVKNLSADKSKLDIRKLEVSYIKSKAGGSVSVHYSKRGKTKIIVFQSLKEAADWLGVSVDYILFGNKKQNNKIKDVTLVFEKQFFIGDDLIKSIKL